MKISIQIAKHLREVYLGNNWTASSLKKSLEDVTWSEATQKVYDFNTIAILCNHLHYYVLEDLKVLDGQKLIAKDELSFTHDPITCQEDWQDIKDQMWLDVEIFSSKIEKLSDETMYMDFVENKYGSYYRNLHGIIEHAYYHIGQIVLIKKILRSE